jgi:hypothetical protein
MFKLYHLSMAIIRREHKVVVVGFPDRHKIGPLKHSDCEFYLSRGIQDRSRSRTGQERTV